MASELLRWNVDGASVIIETDEAEVDGWEPAGVFGGHTIFDAQGRLEDALANVGKVAKAALHSFQERTAQATRPDEIEIHFGVKFGTEAGAIIAKTSLEGQLNVTIRWHAGAPDSENAGTSGLQTE